MFHYVIMNFEYVLTSDFSSSSTHRTFTFHNLFIEKFNQIPHTLPAPHSLQTFFFEFCKTSEKCLVFLTKEVVSHSEKNIDCSGTQWFE